MTAPCTATALPPPRLRCADRSQPLPPWATYDDLLPQDHLARQVWHFVQGLNVEPLYDPIAARQGLPGRSALDPRTLVALWLFAVLDGVLSARYLAKLIEEQHRGYYWLAAGDTINYHTLSDFRTAHNDWLESLLVDGVACLLHHQVVTMETVAQDGLRVRASAGSASFHRQPTLEQAQQQAQAYLQQLQQQEQQTPGSTGRRHQQAQQRAARERQQRLQQAVQELEKLRHQRQQSTCKKQQAKEPRASSTDPQARVMKMADGGFRPAFNVQLAVEAETGLILGVQVTNQGTDAQAMAPMLQQLQDDYGQTPENLLVDGSYAKRQALEMLHQSHPQVKVYAPVKQAQQQLAAGQNPYQAKKTDTAVLAAWRARMGTEEGQALYKKRSSSVEWVNARLRTCGLRQFLVRGETKVKSVLLWLSVAHNWQVAQRLRAAPGVAGV